MRGPGCGPVGAVGPFPTLGSSQWGPATPLVSEAGVPEWQMGGRDATGIRNRQPLSEWLCSPGTGKRTGKTDFLPRPPFNFLQDLP